MPAGEGIAQRFQDVTTYQTNAAGQTWATTYSDGATPAITNYLDRLGRAWVGEGACAGGQSRSVVSLLRPKSKARSLLKLSLPMVLTSRHKPSMCR